MDMSIVDQLDPEGKEIEIGNKKYNQDTKIIFNTKALMSVVIIFILLFVGTYTLVSMRISKMEEKHINSITEMKTSHDESVKELVKEVKQLRDERLISIKEKVDAADAKMELLMVLINNGQVDINDIQPIVDEARSVTQPDNNNLPPLNNSN
jgi:uncharacterized membrane protein YhiD involved in acid resistance